MHTKHNTAARLRCEALEARENPSGNVAVFQTFDGGLQIVGDNFSNSVILFHTPERDVFLVGTNGTAVNGFSSIFLGRGFPSWVRFDMGNGDDAVEVNGLVTPGNVILNGGEGNNLNIVRNTVIASQGDMLLVGGNGLDQNIVQNSWVGFGSIHLFSQGGSDLNSVDTTHALNLEVDGGAGIDSVHVSTSFFPGSVFVFNTEFVV